MVDIFLTLLYFKNEWNIEVDNSLFLTVFTSSRAMKLFQNVQKSFETMGFYSLQTHHTHLFSSKTLLLSLPITIVLISIGSFGAFKAVSMAEYALCFYGCITMLYALGVYFIFGLQMPVMVHFIENCDRFIEQSMYRAPRIYP